MFGMIYNEFIKLFAKKSTIVLIILAIGISVAIPMLNNQSRTHQYIEDDFKEYLKNDQEYYQRMLNGEENVQLGRYDKAYYASIIKVYDILLQTDVDSWNDWRQNNYYVVTEKMTERELISLILKSKKKDKLIQAMMEDGSIYSVDSASLDYYYEKGSTKKLKNRAAVLDEQIEGYTQAFLNNDPLYFNQANLTVAENEITDLNKQIKDIKKQIKETKDKKEKERLNERIEEINIDIQKKEEVLVWTRYRVEHNVSLEYDEWHNRALEQIISSVMTLQEKLKTKEEYEQSPQGEKGMIYEDYVKDFEDSQNRAKENIALYSEYLRIDAPPMELVNDTRSQIEDIYEVITVIGAIIAILGANMVAQEYHKGTIRLLLIRPKKRYKVLSSKIICVVIVSAVLGAICAGAMLGVTVKLFGKEALSYPILSLVDGNIVQKSIFDVVSPVFIKSLCVLPFMLGVTLFFSTVTKSAILAVAFPLVLISVSPIGTFLLANAGWLKFVEYSPLSYFSLWNIINSTGTAGTTMDIVEELTLNPSYGAVSQIVCGIVLIIITYIVFDRRDVKN